MLTKFNDVLELIRKARTDALKINSGYYERTILSTLVRENNMMPTGLTGINPNVSYIIY